MSLPTYLHFTSSIHETLNSHLEVLQPDRIVYLVDEHTRKYCLPKLASAENIVEIRAGENYKTIETCTYIWRQLTEFKCTRNSVLINLGGGVIGDMGGFCASTFKRGISFIQIPTTLLSMVDASIGGKLGVDFGGLKNHIGVFQLPAAVLVHPPFLETLPEREKKSGFAEMIKHALIYDTRHWEELIQLNDWSDLQEKQIKQSIAIKNDVVNQDPKEMGLRKILNFGHTVGHAIESWHLEKGLPLTHGEAIAHGMCIESELALIKGTWNEQEVRGVLERLHGWYPPISMPPLDDIWTRMQQDKKNSGTEVLASIPDRIGNCLYNVSVTRDELENAWKAYPHPIR